MVRGRCREHATDARRLNRSVNDRFYSSKAWRLQRARFLVDHPLCDYIVDGQPCGQVATDVHHRLPIEWGGARRDPDNLRALCRAHHTAIHRDLDRATSRT